MIASGFAAGTSGGASVEEYLTEEEKRLIAPEIFKGDMGITRDLIDTNHRRWKYTSGVLAFHEDDKPTQAQLAEIVQDFEGFMFAGKAPDTFNITWVLHRDKGNTELHFVVPRVDLETGQDLNIAPPGYEKDWKPWVASINHKYGFKDPYAQERKPTKIPHREPPDRRATREQINDWLEAQIAEGVIESREHLLEILGKIGEITRINNKFISLKTDREDKAFRLKGAIYETGFDFKAGLRGARTLEGQHRKTGTGAGYGSGGVSGRDAGGDHAQNRSRETPTGRSHRSITDNLERDRNEAFERRRDFFEKLRNKSRKLQGLRKEDEFDSRDAGREGADLAARLGSEIGDHPRQHTIPARGGGDFGDRSGDRSGASAPRRLSDGLQSAGEGRTGAGEGETASGHPRGLPEALRGLSGDVAGRNPAVRPASGEEIGLNEGAVRHAGSNQQMAGELNHGDLGPFAAAFDRLGKRERHLAEIDSERASADRSHRAGFDQVVQLGESARRAVEQIGRVLRSLVEKMTQQEPAPRPKPWPSGPSR